MSFSIQMGSRAIRAGGRTGSLPTLATSERTPRRRGFSLLEVLLAVVLLGGALVGITEAITLSLHSSHDAWLQSAAPLLAAERVEILRADGFLLAGENDGDFGSAFPELSWRESLTETETDGLYEVVVTVEDSRNGRSLYELKTLLFEIPYDSTYGVEASDRTQERERRRRGARL